MFSNKDKLFSFSYNFVPAKPSKIKTYEENGWCKTEYSIDNLTVINCFKHNGNVYEWLNWLENRSQSDTKTISDICD